MPLGITLRPHQRIIGPSVAKGGLALDAVLEETVGHEARKTAFPIEIGADISDHLIQKPGLYSLRGVVSDHPILWSATRYQHADATTRHLSAYAILRDLWNKRETFLLESGFLTIENAVLVAFHATKSAATANSFNFEAQIDEMVIVNTGGETVESGDVDPSAEGAVTEENAGSKTGTEAGGTAALSAFEFIFGASP